MDIKSFVREGGTLIAFTSIGCYPCIYVANDGAIFCAKCAMERIAAAKALDVEDKLEGDVFYEGSTVECEECGMTIESAYGDPADES